MSKPKSIIAAWLSCARVTDNPEGDLIADMRAELRRGADMPGSFRNIVEMRGYLRSRGACREVLAAVPGVWRRYRNWVDRNGAGWSEEPPWDEEPEYAEG
jgi:hypothetical protein